MYQTNKNTNEIPKYESPGALLRSNDVHVKQWDVITHAGPYYNGGSVSPQKL